MRMLQIVTFPHDTFNAAIRDGSANAKMDKIMGAIQPEAAYFTEKCGKRCAILVVDLADPSKVPALAEPWFLTFNADVHFQVVMSPEDLAKAGLDEVGKKWA